MTDALELKDIRVGRDGTTVVDDVSITVPAGSVHALMGPNGSGKSSLANAVMGHPAYTLMGGSVVLDGEDLSETAPDERSRKGLFLSPQYPPEIPGVTVSSMLRAAVNAHRESPVGVVEFRDMLLAAMKELGIDPSFGGRGLNEGFSGGERKRMEMLQLALLRPKYAILDETDAGLDVDAFSIITDGVKRAKRQGTGFLIITHYPRMSEVLRPDAVHVMRGGRIVAEGGPELAERIGKEGYAGIGAE